MSHIVTVETQARDPVAIRAACTRLSLPAPTTGTTRLFSGNATGVIVQLPDWRYPIICDVATGKVQYDNYENRWGDRQHLDKFLQAYAVEKARIEARKQGHTVTERALPDGAIKLTINVGGAA